MYLQWQLEASSRFGDIHHFAEFLYRRYPSRLNKTDPKRIHEQKRNHRIGKESHSQEIYTRDREDIRCKIEGAP